MNRVFREKIKKVVLWLTAGVSTALMIGLVLIWAFEDKIKALAIESINEKVNTEIKVASIELSIWKHFPNVSVVFNQVQIANAKNFPEPGNLLEAESLSLSFRFWNLFGSDYKVRKLFVEKGVLNILRNADDEVNYIIWKQDTPSSDAKFSLQFEHLQFDQMAFRYADQTIHTDAKAQIKRLKLKGKFSEDIFDLQSEIQGQLESVKVDETHYLSKKSLTADLQLQINTQTETIFISPSEIEIAALLLKITGTWMYAGVGSQLTLKMEGKDMDIRSILSLLPSEMSQDLTKFDSDGDFYFNANIVGKLSKDENPEVKADFGIRKATIKQKEKKINIRNLNLEGKYYNGKRRSIESSVIDISQFSFETSTGQSSGRFRLENLSEPYIDLKADLNLMISEVYAFVENEKLLSPEGKCKGDIAIRGNFKDLNKLNKQGFKGVSASGNLEITQGSFMLKDSDIRYNDINGLIQFENNTIIVKQLIANVSGTTIELNGKLGNVFSFLAGNQQPLYIDAHLKAEELNLENFIGKESKNGQETYDLEFPSHIHVNLKTSIDGFRFRAFTAKDIQGQASLQNGVFEAQKLRFKTMNGLVAASGHVKQMPNGSFLIDCKAQFDRVNIRDLFVAFDNFGQETITATHLQGVLTANLLFRASMKSDLNINQNDVYAITDVKIMNGELINFQPLNALSKFISLDELKHIRFSELKNQIEIKQRKIIIPAMDIKSSALNLSLSGTHGFDNDIDYHINLRLNELLSKKAKRNKKENNEFGEELDDGSGGMRLYLLMTGKVDNPTFMYDRKSAKEARKDLRQKEKEELRNLLRKEFKKEPVDASQPKKKSGSTHKIEIEFDD